MFCIFHSSCAKSVDNGNCSVYSVAGVHAVNTHHRVCGFVANEVYTFKKPQKAHKRNPIKQSKGKGGQL
jgi:hypothetical protein